MHTRRARDPLLLAVLAVFLAACDVPREEPAIRLLTRPALVGPPAALPDTAPHARRVSPKSSALLERLGLAVRQNTEGATIVALDVDGPAAESGARIGDVILAINGAPVASAAELDLLTGAAPRGPVLLEVQRQGERLQVAVKSTEAAGAAHWNALGLQVRELPGAALKVLGVAYGVMVTKVRAPADRTRILPGDVIVGVNHTRIRSLDEFNRLVAEQQPGNVGLLVRRADSDLYIALQLGAAPRNGEASRGGSLAPGQTFKTQRNATSTPLRT